MPPEINSALSLLRAFEGALREGRLLDESIGGILDAALGYFDAAAVVLLPAGGAPPISRAGRSLIAAAAEQNLSKLLEGSIRNALVPETRGVGGFRGVGRAVEG